MLGSECFKNCVNLSQCQHNNSDTEFIVLGNGCFEATGLTSFTLSEELCITVEELLQNTDIAVDKTLLASEYDDNT